MTYILFNHAGMTKCHYPQVRSLKDQKKNPIIQVQQGMFHSNKMMFLDQPQNTS